MNDFEPTPSPSEEDTGEESTDNRSLMERLNEEDSKLKEKILNTDPQEGEVLNITTPVYKKPQEESKIMNFYDALKEVMDGEMITKLEWADDHIYVSIVDKMLMIHLVSDGLFHPLNLSEEDIIGTDWVIVSKN